ncbi:hypothetical protein niasHT_029933 [Heterodera trifolii]|uniref:Uncharacterized protein n=1 Tax=Heterodera trifolii TaxID=157864 RepID=A0ABD2KFN7_9BILA
MTPDKGRGQRSIEKLRGEETICPEARNVGVFNARFERQNSHLTTNLQPIAQDRQLTKHSSTLTTIKSRTPGQQTTFLGGQKSHEDSRQRSTTNSSAVDSRAKTPRRTTVS